MRVILREEADDSPPHSCYLAWDGMGWISLEGTAESRRAGSCLHLHLHLHVHVTHCRRCHLCSVHYRIVVAVLLSESPSVLCRTENHICNVCNVLLR